LPLTPTATFGIIIRCFRTLIASISCASFLSLIFALARSRTSAPLHFIPTIIRLQSKLNYGYF
jgi:hypothetical protein